MTLSAETTDQLRTPFRSSHGKITLVLYNAPHPCGGRCLFCFRSEGVTQSTTANQDTLMSARVGWDAAKQLAQRFRAYGLDASQGLKCDLAVKGDSFANHDPDYLRDFFKRAYDYLNDFESASLEAAKNAQAHAKNRCVSIKVETRPDHINERTCELMAELGVTAVELGVQSLDDEILLLNRRGHDSACVAAATRLLRDYGFEVGFQVMVGLPGGSLDADERLLTEQLWEPRYSPDMLKIYPCVLLRPEVAQHFGLASALESGMWDPLSSRTYEKLLTRCLPRIPRWVHINAIQRIIPRDHIAAGPESVVSRRGFDGLSRCLWQRSVWRSSHDLSGPTFDFSLVTTPQGESGYCVEAVLSDDTAIGYGRLTVGETTAVVRDVRALGLMRTVGDPAHGQGYQHVGVGSAILDRLEALAALEGSRLVRVRPSAGVVTWFESRGYQRGVNRWLEKPIRRPQT